MYSSIQQLQETLKGILNIQNNQVQISNEQLLREKLIDQLIYTTVFSKDDALKKNASELIKNVASVNGIYCSSILPFYQAFGKEEVAGFTVPAINIRTFTYDTARIVFQLIEKHSIGPVVFEIAKSEMEYTAQRPEEYTLAILAAAIKEGYKGPIFLQGDHFQLSAKRYLENPDAEVQKIKNLIQEAVLAQFYNIDIDASTLVDLSKPTHDEQQKTNYQITAELTTYIHQIQPQDIKISIGGEIGHIGGKNSSVEEFEAFMDGYKKIIPQNGISKVSVQTGTSHGGIPLADGSMAQVQLDFSVLEKVGKIAREEYGLGGAVQHGASTLPNELFDQFPKVKTLEIHLATGFQNIVYETIPETIKQEMYQWVSQNLQNEKEEGWTNEQFLYKTRKKALGPFKEKLWHLSEDQKKPIRQRLWEQFELIFSKLAIFNTKENLHKYVR